MSDRFWVNNSGTWDASTTTHWSETSGGAGGASAPTSADTAKFDVNSFTAGSQTITIGTGTVCGAIDFTGCTNSPELAVAANLVVSGNITFIAAMSVSGAANIQIDATCTLTTNALSIACEYISVIAGGNVTLADALTIKNFAVIDGTFASAGFAINCEDFEFYTNSNINIDGSTITVSGGYKYGCIQDGTDVSGIGATIIIPADGSFDIDDYAETGLQNTLAGSAGSKFIFSIDPTAIISAAAGIQKSTFTNVTVTGIILDATDPTNIDGGGNTGIVFTYSESVDEDLILTDTSIGLYLNGYGDIDEDLIMVDLPNPQSNFYYLISELLYLWDENKNGWLVSVSEDLTLTDTLSDLLGLVIHDYLTMIDSQSNNWNGREIISDNVTLFDITEANKRYADSLSDSIDMADLSTYVLSLTILEYMGFTELVQGIKSFAVSTSDTLDLVDLPDSALSLLISETLSVVDANSVITTFVNSIQSDLGLTDVSSLLRTIGTGVTESLVLTETISNKGTLYSAIYDTLAMDVTVELNGDIYECYVLNTPKFYPSMYSGFEFNSFCVFENRAFGANDTGIFELTGSTDNGATIHSGAILSGTDFGSPNQKRFRKGYLGISGSNPVMVFETDDGKRQTYAVDTNGKITVSHELKGKSWVLSVADFDTLDSIKLIPIILTK